MTDATAVRVAIQLHHVPSSVRVVRDAPLPSGVPLLLRVAAGEPEALSEASALTERSPAALQDAARFFIEQILWHQSADSFRVLGGDAETGIGDLKRNMALLMSWLHPDADSGHERSVFVVRVSNAWNDLKTPVRRQHYAEARAQQAEALAAQRAQHQRRDAQRRRSRHRAAPAGVFRRLFATLFKA